MLVWFSFIQIFFCEHFPLNNVEQHVNPIEFWTASSIKKVVDCERDSYKGILHGGMEATTVTMDVTRLDPVSADVLCWYVFHLFRYIFVNTLL